MERGREGGTKGRREREVGKGQMETTSSKIEHSHLERYRASTSVCEGMCESRPAHVPETGKLEAAVIMIQCSEYQSYH